MRYRGLTWDHPRGYNALAAAARRLDETRDGLAIQWSTQPLEDFESHPIDDLCEGYDLVVLDHPHVGEAVARECLVALDDLFTPADIVSWDAETIGPCLASYRWAGRYWALPLDAATQVMALRPDLLEDVPTGWDEVIACSERVPVVLSLAGPHAVLTFFSMAAAFGEPAAADESGTLVTGDVGRRVLDAMATLHDRMPPAARDLNPIGLLEAMATGNVLALCPLVYGYVNYAVGAPPGRHRIAFHDAPRGAAGQPPGSTLGGTGIGVSRRCAVTSPLLDHLRWLMSVEAQVRFIPAHDGQPSRRQAWHDEAVNARWGQFYARTAATLEAAYVRPRFEGYVRFQTDASALLRRALEDHMQPDTVLRQLQSSYERLRRAGMQRKERVP